MCGSAVVPLTADQRHIRPSQTSPAKVQFSARVDSVAAGEFGGTVTVRLSTGSVGKQWRTKLTLTVVEPLSVQSLDCGPIEVGQVVQKVLVVRNAGNELRNLAVVAPRIIAKGGDIIVTVPQRIERVRGQNQEEIPVQIAVSPHVESHGRQQGTIIIRRDQSELAVPIAFTVVGRGEGPSDLLIAPAAVDLQAKPGEVREFIVRVKMAATATRAEDQVSVTAGPFIGPQGRRLTLDVAFQYPDGSKLQRDSAVTAKGFLVAPDGRGRYTATLTITSRHGGSRVIPLMLDVR